MDSHLQRDAEPSWEGGHTAERLLQCHPKHGVAGGRSDELRYLCGWYSIVAPVVGLAVSFKLWTSRAEAGNGCGMRAFEQWQGRQWQAGDKEHAWLGRSLDRDAAVLSKCILCAFSVFEVPAYRGCANQVAQLLPMQHACYICVYHTMHTIFMLRYWYSMYMMSYRTVCAF